MPDGAPLTPWVPLDPPGMAPVHAGELRLPPAGRERPLVPLVAAERGLGPLAACADLPRPESRDPGLDAGGRESGPPPPR